MTREDALILALKSTNDIPQAIAQAKELLEFINGSPEKPLQQLPMLPAPNKKDISIIPREYAILLGYGDVRKKWTKWDIETFQAILRQGKHTALFDAAIELGRSVKSCYDAFQRGMIGYGPFDPTCDTIILIRTARKALRELTGDVGTMGTSKK